MAVVNQVVFKAARRIAEIRGILDALPGWKFSSFAHEHLVETVALHGEICRSARGTVCGFIDGAMVTIAIKDAGTKDYAYELTLHYPNEVQALYGPAAWHGKDAAFNAAKAPFDARVEEILARVGGEIARDQD